MPDDNEKPQAEKRGATLSMECGRNPDCGECLYYLSELADLLEEILICLSRRPQDF